MGQNRPKAGQGKDGSDGKLPDLTRPPEFLFGADEEAVKNLKGFFTILLRTAQADASKELRIEDKHKEG